MVYSVLACEIDEKVRDLSPDTPSKRTRASPLTPLKIQFTSRVWALLNRAKNGLDRFPNSFTSITQNLSIFRSTCTHTTPNQRFTSGLAQARYRPHLHKGPEQISRHLSARFNDVTREFRAVT